MDEALYRAARRDRGLAQLLAGAVFARLRRLRFVRHCLVEVYLGRLIVTLVPTWWAWALLPVLWWAARRVNNREQETLKLWLPTTIRVRPRLPTTTPSR